MIATSLDLDAYFRRIGWTAASLPSLDTLAGLLRAHMRSIPFENIDVLLGRPIPLDLASLQDKLVRRRRGGYCFEHVTLFAAVLEAVGFEVTRHSARVTLFSPREQSPRTHMFLTVRLPEGRFVIDPGFGGPAAPFPIALDDGHPSEHATHWMVHDGTNWILRTQTDKGEIDAWFSTLEQDYAVDFDVENHFTATHPTSRFAHLLMMSIFTDDGRISVMNRDATIRAKGQVTRSEIEDRIALRSFVGEHFGFDMPELETLRVPAVAEWS